MALKDIAKSMMRFDLIAPKTPLYPLLHLKFSTKSGEQVPHILICNAFHVKHAGRRSTASEAAPRFGVITSAPRRVDSCSGV